MVIVSHLEFGTLNVPIGSHIVSFGSHKGLVPTKYADNPALGRWVSTQRSQFKAMNNGEKTTMTEAKYEKLTRLGFVWCMIP